MSDKEQTDSFADALDHLIDKFRAEYDLTYAQAVGVLEMKKWLLLEEASERKDEL